ncbi:hypothetical protein Rhow_006083 [Rhodococcus wratislaviensis]|uniref:FAS1-like dehydratase domain-containing protein n=1 Tax=Rhodococcus wratislaviensis TaxID=44752 RepID=A0A402CEZ2_RHOWR|nr:MaoC family dehydratase N-terminal domain-containing protein [Rhodococcus wratislaviensis]GCE42144.1 hypothetical protein Rhow_006083 [Rhodococcus wratislaviensis]
MEELGPERSFVVEAGHIMMFERALGDEAEYRSDALAPLTFTQAAAHYDPDSPLRPHAGKSWKGAGDYSHRRTDKSVGEGWLHAEQHFEYRRHVRAGETLRPRTRLGRQWTKTGSSDAVLIFAEEVTELIDDAGVPVVTSTIVRVRRSASSTEWEEKL